MATKYTQSGRPLTLMEDDGGVIGNGCCAERSLMADGDSIHYLKGPQMGLIHVDPLMYRAQRTFECPLISPVDEPVSNMNA